MEKLHFEITIQAPAEKVYNRMLGESSFKEWTKEFNESSDFEGSWEKGAKILFIGTDQHGNTGGMVSRIKENIPKAFVSIEHLGILKGEEEITSGPEVKGWAGAMEDYTFEEKDGATNVKVDVDVNEEYKAYFKETWPKALNRLKEICEKYN